MKQKQYVLPLLLSIIAVAVLAMGCPQAELPSTVLAESTVVFANGTSMIKLLGCPTFINSANGIGDGTITFVSSSPSVATVDPVTGEVTVLAVGHTEITATKAATSIHASASAAYTLRVQDYVTLHYSRVSGSLEDWGLHLWQNNNAFTTWANPLMPAGYDDFGSYFFISTSLYTFFDTNQPFNFIIHDGDNKDPNADLVFDCTLSAEAWVISGISTVYLQKP